MNRSDENSPVKAALTLLGGVFGAAILILLLGCLFYFGYLYFSIIYEENKGPYRVIVDQADLDGDGDLDLIVGRTRWETDTASWAGVALWVNLKEQYEFRLNDQELPTGFAAAAADLDSDGDADLLVLEGYRISIVYNQGGLQGGQPGVFKAGGSIPSPNQWQGHTDMGGMLLVGDLNNDGITDSLATGCCYGTIGSPDDPNALIPSFTWISLNTVTHNGILESQTSNIKTLNGVPVRGAALGDLDGDGDLDLFAAVGAPTAGGGTGLADRVLFNDGDGNFIDSGQALGRTDSYAVALGDVDGDGDLDALVGAKSGAFLWINQGGAQTGQAGAFVQGPPLTTAETKAVFLADFNNDGHLDALIAGKTSATLWFNQGRGVFTDSRQLLEYEERFGLAVGDLTGNGHPDIFSGDGEKANRVWFNQGEGLFVPPR